MKILQVCPGLGSRPRGAERFCLELSRRLAEKGHDIELVTGSSTPHNHLMGLKINKIPEMRNKLLRKSFFDYINPLAALEYRRLLETIRPDVVHLHSLYGISSSLVRISSRKYPTLITFHDMWPVFYDPPLFTPISNLANTYWKLPLGWMHRRVNMFLFNGAKVISPANWLIEYAKMSGFGNDMIHIPPAVDCEVTETNYSDEILWVGAITKGKGLAEVLPILVKVAKTRRWRVTIVGDGPERPSLEKSNPDAVFVGASDPEPYYRRASILVISSLVRETGPLVLLEGMARGLCAVGNGIGGVREIILNGFDGILYDSINDLENILTNLIANREKITAIGHEAARKVKHRYNWDECVAAHTAAYSN